MPIELLYDQAKGANNELLKALRAGLQQKQLRFQIRLLRAIDPESSEMAEMVFRHPESHRCDEDNDRQARYPWEDQISDRNANYIDTEGARTNGTNKQHQQQVSKLMDMALDMAGNAWEWCADWSDENYYSVSPAKNPLGPDTGSGFSRVLRGGSCTALLSPCA